MSRLRSLCMGFLALFRKEQLERDMDEELKGYLEAAVKDKIRSGMSPESALRSARVEIGSPDAVKEEVCGSGWESALESFGQDLRYGWGVIRKRLPHYRRVVLSQHRTRLYHRSRVPNGSPGARGGRHDAVCSQPRKSCPLAAGDSTRSSYPGQQH
ncbi:MAG TPA: permease prefix domain 1-containing protein [Terriglobia bacterium]|nr:permease prefix domain 1-containing protein [Terriglobia bacterium]